MFFEDEEFVIKLSYPRVFVRYKVADGYFAEFSEFFNSIAEIQYLDGERPPLKEHKQIMEDIWNYIALEEAKLEEDISEIDFD